MAIEDNMVPCTYINNMKMRKGMSFVLRALLLGLFIAAVSSEIYSKTYDIRDFGAIANDATVVNTLAIQKAIDQCSADGGGAVLVQGGDYVTGTLFMKSGVTLHIERMAKLLGSGNIADYAEDVMKNMYRDEPYMDRCLIFARGQTSIGIEGGGAIDGNGGAFPNAGDRMRYRPMLIRFAECENIRVRDVVLQNPGGWTTAWLYCKDIVVDGITVIARVRGNGDGLDFDGCEGVRVSNSHFDTSDDSICLQTSRKDRPCKNITITNCIFSSRWAGMRIGLLSRANFENVIVTACIFQNINDSGLKIQMNEGAAMKNLLFSNLLMVSVPRPIFMTHCSLRAFVDGEEEYPEMQTIGDMAFSNIQIDNTMLDKNAAIIMTSVPGNYIQNITLSNITMRTAGGGTQADATAVPKEFTVEYFKAQDRRRWPEYGGFGGRVPAYGIYLRHMQNVNLNNVSVIAVNEDARSQMMAVDIKNLTINGQLVNQEIINDINNPLQ